MGGVGPPHATNVAAGVPQRIRGRRGHLIVARAGLLRPQGALPGLRQDQATDGLVLQWQLSLYQVIMIPNI